MSATKEFYWDEICAAPEPPSVNDPGEDAEYERRAANAECNCGHGKVNSHRLDAYGALQCDHCDSSDCITFEDCDGNETEMYVLPNGMLTETPYTPDPIANAVGKLFAVTALLCVIAFYAGVATGGW